jgi:predicted CXXCH cytochrome family protein
MEWRKGILLFSLALSAVCTGLIDPGHAWAAELSDEAKACLGCHSKPGIVKTFQNGESVMAYVDAVQFSSCVHNFLTCSDCHKDFSSGKHPSGRFRSRKQHQIMSSRACRRCHTDEKIVVKPIHASLLRGEKEGRPIICTECHGAHSVTPVAGGRTFVDEENYCLSCHGYALTMAFRSGESISLTIDKSSLKDSVHNKLGCSDCHYGFSSEDHPRRNFRTKREYSLAASEDCRRCHFDKYAKTMESIHYSVLSQGNLNAPVCTDCHGSHSIPRGGRERIFTTHKCQRCHADIYNIYAKSVHGSALFNEKNQDVPVCVDCHKAHDITNPLTLEYHERIPEMCGNCHASKAIAGKYGLSINVVKTYLTDFHGVTLSLYKKQRESLYKPARPIAVCTDCHGTHNISSTRGTDAAILKVNLAKRCQQCHKNATKNFPDAWLSHYEPSMRSAPLVFIVNLLYKVFIPVLVIGLFLQILLHIWRYAVDR